MLLVPEAFAASVIEREGEVGRRWIEALPGLVKSLCGQWGLSVDGRPMHGYLGLVVPVRRGEEPCVLKVSWIEESSRDEARALSVWDGQGAVRLLEAQPSIGAMLLERLDSGRTLRDVGIEEAVVIAGRLLRRLALPAPGDLRRLSVVAEEMAQTLPERWERVGRLMPRRTLDAAHEIARECGKAAGNLLVNYDLHYDDVLGGEREPWLAVDPKVVAGDVEYGIAQLLWTRLEEMIENRGLEWHFQALVEAAELDVERARGWTLVRCVDYWLWGLSVGLTEDPARCERIVGELHLVRA